MKQEICWGMGVWLLQPLSSLLLFRCALSVLKYTFKNKVTPQFSVSLWAPTSPKLLTDKSNKICVVLLFADGFSPLPWLILLGFPLMWRNISIHSQIIFKLGENLFDRVKSQKKRHSLCCKHQPEPTWKHLSCKKIPRSYNMFTRVCHQCESQHGLHKNPIRPHLFSISNPARALLYD